MSTVWAVLLDTVSIQRYIFQSNKLKDNLGASFLIEKIYKEYLENALFQVFGKSFNINAWKDTPEEIRIDKGDPFEVGYIGGGSAFLLFTEEPKAKEFIKTWTKLLLIYAPGVMTGVAMSKFDHEKENFSQEREKLFDELQKNKSQHIPETLLPRHGITAECSRSGLSMDIWNNIVDSYVSAGSNAVIEASKPAKVYINEKKYAEILRPDFCFTNELDELGRISGKDSHIAIVHIDGNSMGERFKAAKTLVDIRKLSSSVAEATESAFVDLLECIKKNYVPIMESLGFDDDSNDSKFNYPRDKKKRKILPILPVILGGDDITFICDGKLGLYFSKIFLKAFESKPVHDEKKLTACAGVAIIKTRYPFYRGYRLAEELCGNAKNENKANKKDKLNSCIDFHISMGGLAGSLEVIRKQYTTPQGKLLFRPYKILSEDNKDVKSFDLLVKNTGTLIKFPRNKIKELRDVMTWSEDARTIFVKKLEYRDLALPKIDGRSKFAESIFDNGETVYFDMIELMEFYPDFELQDSGGV